MFLVDSFSTVSLHPAIVGEVVAQIAKNVNQHHHTRTCRKYKTICRFKMPKLPSYQTIIARPPDNDMTEDDKRKLCKNYEILKKKVNLVLEDNEFITSVLEKHPKEEEVTKEEAEKGRYQRIDAVLHKAGLISEEAKNEYRKALSFNLSGYEVVYARDIDELMVNPYNPEITMAWNGNTDFQFCFDFYAIITYITEYFTKDDDGVIK